ncbi:MAG: HlyD family secretion protein [Armatimonadetes bacterium]|nr:HlyD family secretion protein [Armatimonadota bacterium]
MKGNSLWILLLAVLMLPLVASGGWIIVKGSRGHSYNLDDVSYTPTENHREEQNEMSDYDGDVLTLPGVIEPLEYIPVAAPTTGRISLLKVRDGSKVTKGSLLCIVEDAEARKEIDDARLAYARAVEAQRKADESRKIDIERKQLALETAQAELENYKAQASLALEDAQAALERAQRDLAEYQALYHAKAVSGQEVRIRREKLEDARRLVEQRQAAQNAGIASREKAVEQAKLDLRALTMPDESTRANALAVSNAAAELALSRRRLVNTRVHSPATGIVRFIARSSTNRAGPGYLPLEALGPGVRVYEGEPFLLIATTDRACVRIDVSESKIALLRTGMKAEIHAASGQKLYGRIFEMSVSNRNTGRGPNVFPVTILITSPLRNVRFGMTADVSIRLDK